MNERIFRIARPILLIISLLSLIMIFIEGVEGNYQLYVSIVFCIAAIVYAWQGSILYRSKPKMAILLFVIAAALLAVGLYPIAIR